MSRLLTICLLLSGVWFLFQGGYIHAKAQLAQLLLQQAWAETSETGKPAKPWPWADTWPVARLQMPRLDISHIVLAGASGESLAFGPGRFLLTTDDPSSDIPDSTVFIAGHRDTHFAFLKDVRTGDMLSLQSLDGTRQQFIVDETVIMDTGNTLALNETENQLLLVTCYPFDAVVPGGSQRYIVRASQHEDEKGDTIHSL